MFGLVALFRKLGDQTMDQTEDDSIPHVQNAHCDVVTRTVIGTMLYLSITVRLNNIAGLGGYTLSLLNAAVS